MCPSESKEIRISEDSLVTVFHRYNITWLTFNVQAIVNSIKLNYETIYLCHSYMIQFMTILFKVRL